MGKKDNIAGVQDERCREKLLETRSLRVDPEQPHETTAPNQEEANYGYDSST